MAVYGNMIRNRGVRSSTIIQPDRTNAAGQIVQHGAVTSKARTTAAHTHVTAKDATDPDRLVQVINRMQDDIAASTAAQRSNPFSTPCIQRGCTATVGQTVAIPHTLKRAYSDWHPSNVTGGWTLVKVDDPATLAKYPANQFLVLKNTGLQNVTFNVIIVGD